LLQGLLAALMLLLVLLVVIFFTSGSLVLINRLSLRSPLLEQCQQTSQVLDKPLPLAIWLAQRSDLR